MSSFTIAVDFMILLAVDGSVEGYKFIIEQYERVCIHEVTNIC